MKKKLIIIPVLVLCLSLVADAQTQNESACEVEQLAIDAALGKTVAQYNLAVRFYTGNGVPKDWSKSAYLWGKAVEAGEIKAYNNLGYVNYHGGNGHTANPEEGIKLWRRAAKVGFAESQLFLGTAYSDGKVLPIDLVEAYAWTETGKYSAARLDEKNVTKKPLLASADEKLDALTAKMTPAQLAAGKARAKSFISKYGAVAEKPD